MGSRKLSAEERLATREEREVRNARQRQNLAESEAYNLARTCRHGHELRKGPLGLKVCEVCTVLTMEEIRRRRSETLGIKTDG